MWPITTIFVGLYDVVLTCNRSSIKTKRNESTLLMVVILVDSFWPNFKYKYVVLKNFQDE